jgi:hypothetical protein
VSQTPLVLPQVRQGLSARHSPAAAGLLTAQTGDQRACLLYPNSVKKLLHPLDNWFQGGGPHGISLGRDVARALGLSPEKRETGEVRLFAGEEAAGEGSVNAHNSGRVSGLDLLFAKLGVHQNAMVPLELSVEEDDLGQKLVFVVAEDLGETVPDELPDDRLPPSQKDAFGPIGRPYTNVGQLPPSAPIEPFDVDPDNVDRGKQAHASTQDALADFLRSQDIEPLCPAPGEPEFDIAWEHDGTVFIAEVKSITDTNEEKQLRLGLGQVLRYRHLFGRKDISVVAVLVAEREPTDASWIETCQSSSVWLAWPAAFEQLLCNPSTAEAHGARAH